MKPPRHLRGVGFRQWNAVIWRFGGTGERLVLVLIVLTVSFMICVLLWFILTLASPYPPEFYVTVVLALTNILTLRVPFSVAVFTLDSWRELLRRGHFRPYDDVASRYVDYLEKNGWDGHLPGAFRWALGYFALYYGLIALSVIFFFIVFPVLGWLTPAAFLAIDAPTVISCALVYKSRMSEPLNLVRLPKSPPDSPRSNP